MDLYTEIQLSVFSRFKEWYFEVVNFTGKKLKHLRIDNGLEYLSEEFLSFCDERVIVRQLYTWHSTKWNRWESDSNSIGES